MSSSLKRYFKIDNNCRFVEDYKEYQKSYFKAIEIFQEAMKKMKEIFEIESEVFYMTKSYLEIDLTENDKERFKEQLKVDGTFKKYSTLSKKWLELTKDVPNGYNHRPSLQTYINNFPLYGTTSSQIFKAKNQWYGSTTSSYEGDYQIPHWLKEIKASEFFTALESIQEK